MSERLRISDLEDGSIIIPDSYAFFLVKRSALRTGKNDTRFIDIELSDGLASVNGKVWKVSDEITKVVESGNIIKILSGRISKYQSNLQVVIEDADVITQEELENYPGIIPQSEFPIQKLEKEWQSLKDRLDDEYLAVINKFEESSKVWNLFRLIPAGKSMHHAYQRGLWEHTISMANLAFSIASQYREQYNINESLIILGCMLHDVGKVFEFTVNSNTHLVEKYSDRGRLLGHIYMGTTYVEKLLNEIIPANSELKMELLHIMLSHHGEYEFGSPKIPKTMEAFIISAADNLDAHLNSIHYAPMAGTNDPWTGKIYSLDRQFYKNNDTKISDEEE